MVSSFFSARYLGSIFGLFCALFAAIDVVHAILPKGPPSSDVTIICSKAWGLQLNQFNLSMVACTSNNNMEYMCPRSSCSFPNELESDSGMFKECVQFEEGTNAPHNLPITWNVPALSYEVHPKDTKSLEGFTIVQGVGRTATGPNAGEIPGFGETNRFNCSWTKNKPYNSMSKRCKDCELRAILKNH